MRNAVQTGPRHADPVTGERLAAWWLTLGRSPRQIVDELVRNGHVTEDEARAAIDEARRNRSMSYHPAGSGRSRRPELRIARMVL